MNKYSVREVEDVVVHFPIISSIYFLFLSFLSGIKLVAVPLRLCYHRWCFCSSLILALSFLLQLNMSFVSQLIKWTFYLIAKTHNLTKCNRTNGDIQCKCDMAHDGT